MPSAEELARHYSGYSRDELEQAVALGPLDHNRDAWIALCAECDKRGIPWNLLATDAPLYASDALRKCREAAITCAVAVGLLACIAGYFIVAEWKIVSREMMIWILLVTFFAFLALVVKKMHEGSAMALWAMAIMLGLLLWFAGVDMVDRPLSGRELVDLVVLVPAVMEIMVVRAIVAMRKKARLRRA